MKALLLLCFLFSSFFVQAGDSTWKIIKDDKSSEYRLSNGKMDLRLEEVNVTPVIDGTKKYGENLVAISFLAISSGTTEIIEETRAALFDKKQNKFLGVFPYSNYSTINGMETAQPKWLVKDKKLLIIDSGDIIQGTFNIE